MVSPTTFASSPLSSSSASHGPAAGTTSRPGNSQHVARQAKAWRREASGIGPLRQDSLALKKLIVGRVLTKNELQPRAQPVSSTGRYDRQEPLVKPYSRSEWRAGRPGSQSEKKSWRPDSKEPSPSGGGGRFSGRQGPGSRRRDEGRRPREVVVSPPRPKERPEGLSAARAYAAVCLLRVEQGGAYSDLIFGSSFFFVQNPFSDVTNEEQVAPGAAAPPGARETNQARVDDLGSYVERTLGFWPGTLDARDRRKVTRLVADATRWRRYLDFLLSHFWAGSPDSFDRMEPLLKQVLRLGMLEIVKMGTPKHAAVHQAVSLASSAVRPGAAALVNAMLRQVVEAQESGRLPSPLDGVDASNERALARALATVHSHPVWMVRRWLTRHGREGAERLMEWNNSPPSFFLRPNPLKGATVEGLLATLEAMEVPCRPAHFLPDFVHILGGMQTVMESDLLREGVCNVQDESAGLVVRVLDPQEGETVVDCCSAPGGKALYAAALLRGKGRVVAVDVNSGRAAMVKQAAQRQGLEGVVETVVADARNSEEIPVEPGSVDKVLLDAPCSGLGVLAKRADLRWRRTAEGEDALVWLQDQLLDAAARLVKPGGHLVYSTCSTEPRENEERARGFIERHKDFVIEPVTGLVPEGMVTADGFFASLPQVHGIDGAFAARFRRLLES